MRIGRYRLLERLGAGGMGEVYRAMALGSEGFAKPVVIKQLRRAQASDPHLVQRLVREAKVLMNLSHRNVVQVFDLGQVDNEYFIAMEYVDGRDLHLVLERCRQRGRWPTRELAVHIVVEVLRGLDCAHRCTDASGAPLFLVHRDITPSNILCSFEGEVRLTDFGLARTRLRSEELTGNFLVGTCRYMSPEQVIGADVDQRSDLFSLGSVLYLLLSGEQAFPGTDPTQVLERIVAADYQRLRARGGRVRTRLRRVLEVALARDREHRYPTAAAMLAALEAYEQSTKRASSSQLRRFMHELFADDLRAASTDAGDPLLDALLELDIDRPDTDELSQFRKRGVSWLESSAQGSLTNGKEAPAAAVIERPSVAVIETPRAVPAQPGRGRSPWIIGITIAIGLLIAAMVFWHARISVSPVVARGATHYADARVASRAAADARLAGRASSDSPHGAQDAATSVKGRLIRPRVGSRRHRARVRRAVGRGYLRVITQPAYAEVYVKGRKVGETPCRIALAAGRHLIRLVNANIGVSVTRLVVVREGRETRLDLHDFASAPGIP